jgi:hypothetical protein
LEAAPAPRSDQHGVRPRQFERVPALDRMRLHPRAHRQHAAMIGDLRADDPRARLAHLDELQRKRRGQALGGAVQQRYSRWWPCPPWRSR